MQRTLLLGQQRPSPLLLSAEYPLGRQIRLVYHKPCLKLQLSGIVNGSYETFEPMGL